MGINLSKLFYFKLIIGSRNLKEQLHKVGALQTTSASFHSNKHKKKKGPGAGKEDSSDDCEDITPRGKKHVQVLVKHEFPLKDIVNEKMTPSSSLERLSSSSSNGGKTTGLSSLERLAKQRETLNQLLDMTAEDSTEWNEIKTKIKANLYR